MDPSCCRTGRYSIAKTLCNEVGFINDVTDHISAMDRDNIYIIDAREALHSRAYLVASHE